MHGNSPANGAGRPPKVSQGDVFGALRVSSVERAAAALSVPNESAAAIIRTR